MRCCNVACYQQTQTGCISLFITFIADETTAASAGADRSRGAALGPDWTNILPIRGSKPACLSL